jgi:hypothetical protein
MSQENVELVRRMFWAFDNDVDAWLSMLSPEPRRPAVGCVRRRRSCSAAHAVVD